MKKHFLTALLSFSVLSGQTQILPETTDLLGSWTGKLETGATSLTLVIHFEHTDRDINVTFDSPDQGAKGIPMSKDYLSRDSVALKVASIGASYHARIKDGKLDGKFTQNGHSFPLVLSKGAYKVNRPQHPQPPFPYKTEEVTFRNEADNATLAGTLTYPTDYTPHANQKPIVVLLITGSGLQNRDEEVMNHKPFLVIADYFARNGIATLRYDDRATGASFGGEVKNATTEDFMRDAEAGIDFLRKTNKFKMVGCLGHSEGGSIAFMLGARDKTDFIISLAAPGVKGDTLLAAQNNRILELSGQPANVTVEQCRQTIAAQSNPWLQWFINYDPTNDIRNTHCPVLAINGERDCQVISRQNLSVIKELLPSSKRNLVKEYPALNHLFQHCITGLSTEYASIEETISPEVLQDMVMWIQECE